MVLLILGLILWIVPHLFKRAAPDLAQGMNVKTRKLGVAILSLAAIVLMVIGYRGWEGTFFWGPSAALTGINNLLMLGALYIYACGAAPPGRPRNLVGTKLRHPQLLGFSLWAVAHLLVNGDTPSFVLFGGLLIWALVSIVMINRADPNWTAPAWGGARSEIRVGVITLIVFGIISAIHIWLGYNPFGG